MLSSFGRLEIYNRQYRFRVIGAIAEDFPALSAVLGEKVFDRLVLSRIFERTHRGHGIAEKSVWHVLKKAAANMNIPSLAQHYLRRSRARLWHDDGVELEQIQFLLGHVSEQSTERYIGYKQRLRVAVKDRLGAEPG